MVFGLFTIREKGEYFSNISNSNPNYKISVSEIWSTLIRRLLKRAKKRKFTLLSSQFSNLRTWKQKNVRASRCGNSKFFKCDNTRSSERARVLRDDSECQPPQQRDGPTARQHDSARQLKACAPYPRPVGLRRWAPRVSLRDAKRRPRHPTWPRRASHLRPSPPALPRPSFVFTSFGGSSRPRPSPPYGAICYPPSTRSANVIEYRSWRDRSPCRRISCFDLARKNLCEFRTWHFARRRRKWASINVYHSTYLCALMFSCSVRRTRAKVHRLCIYNCASEMSFFQCFVQNKLSIN